ncbi:MAG: hypothetical protein NPIRA04_12210 [Nitrospirales bacterium]|nr:MAG: hypothetical protein NPIRA04_12210 [Nitrospirales bacterium]
MVWRFFKCLEESISRTDREAICVVNHANFSHPQKWTINDVMFDFSNPFDFDLRVLALSVFGVNEEDVRMNVCHDLLTGSAGPACVGYWGVRMGVAIHGLNELHGRHTFANGLVAYQYIGVGEMI